MSDCRFDITYDDFNPSVFFAFKETITKDSVLHVHDFTQLLFVMEGKGSYYIDGMVYEIVEGDILIINTGLEHGNIVTSPENPAVEFLAGFSNFHFRNMQPNTIQLKDGSYLIHTNITLRNDITKHISQMIAENDNNYPGKYFMLKTHLMQILLLMVRDIVQPIELPAGCNFESYNKSYVVKQIIHYLETHYYEKISLDQIAHNMYLSPVYISKIFKEETGESPINFLIKIRLEKAKEMLSPSNQDSIKNIANRVGYDDVYHFSKLFKKYYGISPLYYKKRA